jgi:glycosyltransferase involved in cell wall biosynthesis
MEPAGGTRAAHRVPPLAYIASRYPFVSHTFILREVLALRRAGVQVDTYTVRRPGPEHILSAEDREAHATTEALVPARPSELMAAHLRALVAGPGRYLATLRLAFSLRSPGARGALWQLFYFAEAVLAWHKCRPRGTRHLHAHHANVASDVALLAAHLGGDGWSWSFTMHGPTELFDVREHRLAEKTARADGVVCISDYARSQVMALVGTEHWHKLRIVHCGLDVDRFAVVDRGGRQAREVLTVGRTVPVKGQALLIEAIAELARRGVEARLTVIGDGPQLPELRDLAERLGIAGRVELAGAVGQEEIGGYYERADVFAMPSFAEGLPVVLMEALATGLPVVATRITGVPELVEDGVSGLLVAPGQVEELAGALARLLAETAERRADMGRRGRERVEAEFAIERTTPRLLDAFSEMVAKGAV